MRAMPCRRVDASASSLATPTWTPIMPAPRACRQEITLRWRSDNGQGMDERTRAHLFEPFFTTKQPGQGTGLGLATVKAIVNQAGGSIAVESAPGRGTRMRVLLPRVEGELEWYGSQAHDLLPLAGRETVLLVEDDERVRTSVEQVLAQCGYQVLVAANGGEALSLVRRHRGPIHLLLVDLVMPGANGREVVKQIVPLQP